jgi:autotransporter strand-loop-strand O-heptosyltransferase
MWCRLSRSYYTKWTLKILEDGNEIYSNQLNLNNKRVLISFDSKSLGDSIAWMPYVEEFRKKHNCHVVLSTFWNNLFEKLYPEIEFISPGAVAHNLIASYKIGWFYSSSMEPVLPNTIPLQKAITNILGLDFKEIHSPINFKPRENPIGKKYVTIATHSTAGLKYWNNPTGWQEVIDYLMSKGIGVIHVSKEPTDLKNVIQLNETSIENTMNYIHHSEFFIGLSSGLSWLAWGLGKRVVMISNFTEPDHEFTTNCDRIINKSVCNGCWNNPMFKFDKGNWNWCPEHEGTERQFECHKQITSEMVIDVIKNLI